MCVSSNRFVWRSKGNGGEGNLAGGVVTRSQINELLSFVSYLHVCVRLDGLLRRSWNQANYKLNHHHHHHLVVFHYVSIHPSIPTKCIESNG